MKELELRNGNYLVVAVPIGADDFGYDSNTGGLYWYLPDYGLLQLPKHDYLILDTINNLTEEQCKDFVEEDEDGRYLDYVLFRGHLQNYCYSAKESFISLLRNEGLEESELTELLIIKKL
jgi:hypothetical protein